MERAVRRLPVALLRGTVEHDAGGEIAASAADYDRIAAALADAHQRNAVRRDPRMGLKEIERVVDHGNGWNPAGVPLEHLKGMIDGMRAAALAKGKRPEDFEVVYRAFWHPTKDEFRKLEDFGVSHVILDLNFNRLALDAILKKMAEIKP